MRRYVSIFLPRFATDRIRRTARSGARDETPPVIPMITVAMADNALRVQSVCHRAAREGLHPGQMVTDAQALVRPLQVEPDDPHADQLLLDRLGRWALSKSPLVMIDAPGGLMIDTTGASHLAGGEAALLNSLRRDLARFGFEARLALAPTQAGAWALAHFGAEPVTRIAPGRDALADALHPLPMEALRIPKPMAESLTMLGLKTIGDLRRAQRASLTRRFGKTLLMRADQALGRAAEPFTPLMPKAPHQVHLNLIEPVSQSSHIASAIAQRTPRLAESLTRQGAGALRLCLTLGRVDGADQHVRAGLAQPSRDPDHLGRLLTEGLARDEAMLDAGFGYEKLTLTATETAPLAANQNSLVADDAPMLKADDPALAGFIDRVSTRLGAAAIHRLAPRDSHWPERAQTLTSPARAEPAWDDVQMPPPGTRPLRLLPHPEPIEAMAPIPDGPPARIIWRKVAYRITQADGPERLAPQWWELPDHLRAAGAPALKRIRSRDYYRLEDEQGRRFWVFRAGLYGPDLIDDPDAAPPRWYLHGLFE